MKLTDGPGSIQNAFRFKRRRSCVVHLLRGTVDGMRILVVEDEPRMAQMLRRGLDRRGHATDLAGTGADARFMAQAVTYEAIVLDVMLPDGDGFEVCAELRSAQVWTPVLMLTARDA